MLRLLTRTAVSSAPRPLRAAAPVLFAAGLVAALAAAPVARAAADASWVERSNAHSQVLLDIMGKLSPEQAAFFGVPGLDEEITDITPGFTQRQVALLQDGVRDLQARLQNEKDPAVRQDLEILIGAAQQQIKGMELDDKLRIPFLDVNLMMFQATRALLDDQVPPERRAAALVRLRKYAGLQPGYTPYAKLAEAYTRERMAVPGLLPPAKDEVENALANGAQYRDGIGPLFEKYGIDGYQEPLAALMKQLDAYESFVRDEILPTARTDFRLPPELYAYQLEQTGVDMPVEELQSRAKVAFKEIQNQMQMIAPVVAKERGWSMTDYRDVIRALKKEQLEGDAILTHYQARIAQVEDIIRREGIVTLPGRDMQIKLATAAESAVIPAPNMRPPRLLGNTGEMGVFVLPLQVPGENGETATFDDFTFEAASWTLTAHEGRPGHELQFSAIIESGVPVARALFSFNSVNVEGWGLYAESELQPYEPLEGQLITLQHRLMRSARAFLDPGLQLGTISKDEAYRVLQEDVVLSRPMANQEVERYTFWAPGQAPAYFVGYNRLLEIRSDAERALGARFDRHRFNDFVLAQGLVTPTLLRKAVWEQFVPVELAAN